MYLFQLHTSSNYNRKATTANPSMTDEAITNIFFGSIMVLIGILEILLVEHLTARTVQRKFYFRLVLHKTCLYSTHVRHHTVPLLAVDRRSYRQRR